MKRTFAVLFLLVTFSYFVHAQSSIQNDTEHERNKRTETIVTLYENLNYGEGGGASLTIDDSTSLVWNSLVSVGLNNKISSLRFYPTSVNWFTTVCKGVNQGGGCWGFRSVPSVPDLRDFGFNNDIESMQTRWMGSPANDAGNCGLTVYSDSSLGGKSIYIGPGEYPDITTAAYLGHGSFPNDAMSSVYLLPYTRAIFYKDKNPDWNYSEKFIYQCYPGNPSMQDCLVSSLGNKNDWVSAIAVYCF